MELKNKKLSAYAFLIVGVGLSLGAIGYLPLLGGGVFFLTMSACCGCSVARDKSEPVRPEPHHSRHFNSTDHRDLVVNASILGIAPSQLMQLAAPSVTMTPGYQRFLTVPVSQPISEARPKCDFKVVP